MDPDERTRQLRAREISQLESQLKVEPPSGCFGFLIRYAGVVILLLVAAVVMFLFTDWGSLMIIVYPVGIVGVYWLVASIIHDSRKSRLRRLLREEKKDLRRSSGKRWWQL